ncbi:MAG: hypothetical protein R2706_09395 [Acidimicrobiales bacterium]
MKGKPVPDVAFSVELDGVPIGEGVTDADGIFFLPVDDFGDYTITISPDTLPENITLKDPTRTQGTATVEENRTTGRAIFAVESRSGLAAADSSKGFPIIQRIFDGAKFGIFLAMGAIGLSIIFGTTGLTNFAHAEIIVFGMMSAYAFNVGLFVIFPFMSTWGTPFGSGVTLVLAALLAIVMGGLLGLVLDKFLFAPMRRLGIGLISQMIVTIGLSIAMRYLIKFAIGDSPYVYRQYVGQKNIDLWLVSVPMKDLVSIVICVAVLAAVGLMIQRTRMGKAMRAVADNRDLAESSGIDVERVIRLVWISGAALAALGGVMLGLSDQVYWLAGFRYLLPIFAGVTLGGLGTAYGALVGCLIVGIGIQVSTLVIAPELKNGAALLVMIVVLMVRPQGILGKAQRIG